MGFKFQGFDFLHLDKSFSEDELLVRRTARDFVEDNLIPIIEECFRTELGFFGANLDGYGCAGMSNVEYGLVMQELERGDSGFRSFVSVQSALVMYPIYTFGSDEQKNKWLPALAIGEKLGCFGLTEPGFGSNPGGMTTTARKTGDEYILNGEKMWITSGNIAEMAGCVGSWSRQTGPVSKRTKFTASGRYALRSPADSRFKTFMCRRQTCYRARAA
jgi:glutaryl-CoA dehydrogenase